MRFNLSVTMQPGHIHGAKVSYRPGTKVPNLPKIELIRAISPTRVALCHCELGANVQEAWPPVPIGLVLGVILLAKLGASHVNAHLTVVPSATLDFTALEAARRASS
jgi:hypothetical protein